MFKSIRSQTVQSLLAIIALSIFVSPVAQAQVTVKPSKSAGKTTAEASPLMIDCRSSVEIQQQAADNSGGAGIGAAVNGISESGIIIGCEKVYRCLDKIPPTKAAVTFDWYHNVMDHKKGLASNSHRKCLMIMMPSDWDKLQQMSGLKIRLGDNPAPASGKGK